MWTVEIKEETALHSVIQLVLQYMHDIVECSKKVTWEHSSYVENLFVRNRWPSYQQVAGKHTTSQHNSLQCGVQERIGEYHKHFLNKTICKYIYKWKSNNSYLTIDLGYHNKSEYSLNFKNLSTSWTVLDLKIWMSDQCKTQLAMFQEHYGSSSTISFTFCTGVWTNISILPAYQPTFTWNMPLPVIHFHVHFYNFLL